MGCGMKGAMTQNQRRRRACHSYEARGTWLSRLSLDASGL